MAVIARGTLRAVTESGLSACFVFFRRHHIWRHHMWRDSIWRGHIRRDHRRRDHIWRQRFAVMGVAPFPTLHGPDKAPSGKGPTVRTFEGGTGSEIGRLPCGVPNLWASRGIVSYTGSREIRTNMVDVSQSRFFVQPYNRVQRVWWPWDGTNRGGANRQSPRLVAIPSHDHHIF